MRRKERRGSRRIGLHTQREVIRDAMLLAGKEERWLTLSELARLTGYGEASISAQLRHLRKLQYGAFVVTKRSREEGRIDRYERGPLWEYRLRRRRRAHSRTETIVTQSTACRATGTFETALHPQKRRQERRTPKGAR